MATRSAIGVPITYGVAAAVTHWYLPACIYRAIDMRIDVVVDRGHGLLGLPPVDHIVLTIHVQLLHDKLL